ncbi:glycoside hydrolase family 2 protein [Mucilaginibacter gilvus]|uniref:Glycoside hydrolase family 2 protein n=1 Tax=Mucilaginibacter gilvus TaxID=2305909 RepID=A0A444MMB6_9SPHI|nr:glycoside hydrolase family 2 TIM barrel-domain containing protein [Mucilaginibacter gilvus]RWY50838.1 glycoside hydrolase family 2 protein [Mucilaginibacter gilvus]
MKHSGRQFVILFMLMMGCSNAYAQQKQRLTNNWEFIKQDLGGVWEAIRPVSPGKPEAYPAWSKVTLPHCFNDRDGVDPDVNYYQGPGWYRTQLNINNPYAAERTILHFEGAGQKTKVYLYDKLVGTHNGGYDEWTVDITDAIADFKKTTAFTRQYKGKVPVEIRCDNTRDLESIPSQLSDFNIYGGLYRHVNLIYLPQVSIDKLYANAELDKGMSKGWITPKIDFYNPTGARKVSGELLVKDANGKIILKEKFSTDTLRSGISLPRLNIGKPHLWSTIDPYLYTIDITGTADGDVFKHTEKVGFRNFLFVDNGPFNLNGKRLLLKGTHRHEDHAGVAAALTDSIMLQEMLLIKEMGANFIRLGHYQQSKTILNLCDSLGLLVWEEEPWCRGGLGGDAYKAQAKNMLTNMIRQHYNHPSIILWGLGNENDWPGDFAEFDKQKIRAFMSEQNDLVHRLDPSRKTTIRRCDFCRDIPDVYSPTIWAGWYKGFYPDYKKFTEEEFKKVPHFIHAEWGGDSHANRHSEEPDKALAKVINGKGISGPVDSTLFSGITRIADNSDWSETYICNLFDWHLKEQEQMPWLTGSAFWTFKDFSTPIRPENPVPYVNQKGVVERDFTKKESYYVVQSYWSDKLMAHIYGHSWPERWGNSGEEKMVKVYSNADRAELFLNGKSQGFKTRDPQNFPAAGLRWMVVYNKGVNSIKVVAYKGKLTVTDTITQSYQTEKWAKPVKVLLVKTGDKDGVATVEARVYDANGVPCLDAANWINFSLSGNGTLIDDLGTSKGSRKLQAYNGRAVISVRLNGGNSVIGVFSPGLPVSFLKL